MHLCLFFTDLKAKQKVLSVSFSLSLASRMKSLLVSSEKKKKNQTHLMGFQLAQKIYYK